jgi:hypothetical protein
MERNIFVSAFLSQCSAVSVDSVTVVHCRCQKQLDWIRALIEKRLARCKLQLNSEKI